MVKRYLLTFDARPISRIGQASGDHLRVSAIRTASSIEHATELLGLDYTEIQNLRVGVISDG